MVCWSDALVKKDEMSVYFLFPFSDAFLGPYGQINILVFSQSGQPDFFVIAIGAERLQVQTKTTRRQPTFTFGKCKEMFLGTLNKMNFHQFIEVGIYSQPEMMRSTDAIPWKVMRHFLQSCVIGTGAL